MRELVLVRPILNIPNKILDRDRFILVIQLNLDVAEHGSELCQGA